MLFMLNRVKVSPADYISRIVALKNSGEMN